MRLANHRKRFMEKVLADPKTGCWVWTGPVDRDGYGRSGRSKLPRLAHRRSWELFRGFIPKDLCVLHHCDNPPCVKGFV